MKSSCFEPIGGVECILESCLRSLIPIIGLEKTEPSSSVVDLKGSVLKPSSSLHFLMQVMTGPSPKEHCLAAVAASAGFELEGGGIGGSFSLVSTTGVSAILRGRFLQTVVLYVLWT